MAWEIGPYEYQGGTPVPIPPTPLPIVDVYLKTPLPVIIHKRRKPTGKVELTVDKDMKVTIG